MRLDAAAQVGRKGELARLRELIQPAQEGVFWLGGAGGIGKSYLLAALCQEPALAGDPKKLCLIAWRFKTSDQSRGNRTAFFRHAVARLAEWLGKTDGTPSGDVNELFVQLVALLNEVARLSAPSAHPQARPPRLLFVLDGLDEIARLDPSFVRLPLELRRANVIWLCAGRPVDELTQLYTPEVCTHVFTAGLPPMSADDIRSMLLAETGELKYDLLRLDSERAGEPGASAPGVQNAAVEAVVQRAEGLPLYVRLVIEDLVAGHLRWDELEQKLPQGLVAYYNALLSRWGLSALRTLLTPLVATIAWAKEPLEEETLFWLLVRSGVLLKVDEARRALLRQGLDAVQGLLRQAAAPGGGVGYEPYHLTFGEHLRQDPAGVIGQENERATEALLALAREWASVPAGHPARRYALRWGPRTLLDVGRVEDAAALLVDWRFLEAKAAAGLVFDLVSDFSVVVEALPAGDERRLLELLEEALRRDIHFIDRHHQDYPQGLFQCLWNSAWWYDCPEAAAHYTEGRPPGQSAGLDLHRLLQRWREVKEQQLGVAWLRSLRPPPVHLGTALKQVFRGHENVVTSVAFSPDGRRIASGAIDQTVRVWDAATGAALLRLEGHEGRVLSVAFSPDGRRVASGEEDNTVRVWDTATGAPLLRLQGCKGPVSSVAFSPDGRRIASGAFDKTVWVWDAATGAALLRLEGHEEGVTSVAFSADGRRIASGAWDKTVRVWDAATGAALLRLQGHKEGVTSVAFSPDGRRIASGGGVLDQTVRVWDAATGQCLEVIHHKRHAGKVFPAATSGPGRVPWRHLETALFPPGSEEPIAWFSVPLDYSTEHPAGPVVAGASGNHVYLLVLEGTPPVGEQS